MNETEIRVDNMYTFIYHSMMTLDASAISEEAKKESVRKLINQGPATAMVLAHRNAGPLFVHFRKFHPTSLRLTQH